MSGQLWVIYAIEWCRRSLNVSLSVVVLQCQSIGQNIGDGAFRLIVRRLQLVLCFLQLLLFFFNLLYRLTEVYETTHATSSDVKETQHPTNELLGSFAGVINRFKVPLAFFEEVYKQKDADVSLSCRLYIGFYFESFLLL